MHNPPIIIPGTELSSDIRVISYDADAGTLEVEFRHGDSCEYADVSVHALYGLTQAEVLGRKAAAYIQGLCDELNAELSTALASAVTVKTNHSAE